MSFETVKKVCLRNVPDIDIEKLDSSILYEMARFDRMAKAHHNKCQSIPLSMFEMTKEENQTATQARNAYYEQHKLEYNHQYLEFLCNLYDYKPEESLTKSI